MPTLFSDLIKAIPIAGRGDVISPESHNSIREAIEAIVTELVAAGGVPDNSVTTQKIADNAVTPAKIPNGTLPLSKLKATVLTGRSIIPAQSDQEIEIFGLSQVEGHTFLLASVIAISRPDRPGAGVRSVRLEWKLQRLVDSDADPHHLLMVHNFSIDRVEVEHKIYVLAE
jgi:hypothetical protein